MNKKGKTKGNVITRPMGLRQAQKPGKGPKPGRKANIPGLPSKGVKPNPVMMKGKLVYQPK